MKRTHMAAILASLTLALPSCGGDDKNDPAPAAGTSPPAQAERPSESTAQPDERAPAADPQNGNGGSSAADAKRALAEDKPAARRDSAQTPTQPGAKPKRKSRAPKTPAEHIASLSPSERRRLDRDLYQQGKDLCYAYGPKQLAKDYNFPTTDPATVARLYARAYEAATPTLILPYQQGCLAGFKRYARNPPD